MKVIAINGSPHAEGNTALALKAMAEELTAAGAAAGTPIETEILHIGNSKIRGCLACGACGKNKNERCIIADDPVNDAIQKMKSADAIILGAAVHFAGVCGTMKSFCDRAFYVSGANGGLFAGKVGASVVAVRRSGGATAWQGLNFYLVIAGLAIVPSTYWSIVHGTLPGEAAHDLEGLQTVRNAARNIARMLLGPSPATEPLTGARTNFIR